MTKQHNPIIQPSTVQRCGIFTKTGSRRAKGPSETPGMDSAVECKANPGASMQDVNQRDSNAQRSFHQAMC